MIYVQHSTAKSKKVARLNRCEINSQNSSAATRGGEVMFVCVWTRRVLSGASRYWFTNNNVPN